jgi:Glycine zipper
MITILKKPIMSMLLGLSLLVLGATGCATLTGATLGGAAGAGIGAATHSNVGRSAAIGAGIGGTAGAVYDIYSYNRRHRDRDYYYD